MSATTDETDKAISHIDTGYVYTYPYGMNLTLSIDDRIVQQARRKAAEMGTTVNQLVRDRLAEFAGDEDSEAAIARFVTLSGLGDSQGWKWSREEIYQDRLEPNGKA